ncbi:MAG TPA: molybdopterin converting factor subunit 1 [Alphaproteobacteria bacterium]|nr:molybdopterin converting factor subunit 1 [Alphaproteobacteria bacterium]
MTILYFAWLRERTKTAEETIDLPDGVTDVAGLIDWLKSRGPNYEEAFKEMKAVRVAVNQEHMPLTATIEDGDEVAFFPPVTGG